MTYPKDQGRNAHGRRIHEVARWWDPRTWLAFIYWGLRTVFTGFSLSGDDLASWKAVTAIMIFEFFAMVGVTNAAAVFLGHRLMEKDSSFIFFVGCAAVLVNMPALLGKNKRWNALSAEFDGYSRPARVVGEILVVLMVVGVIIGANLFAAAERHLP